MAHRFRTADKSSPAARQRAREYASPQHRAQRAADKRLIDSGRAHCWRCGQPIPRGTRFHSGHDDHDRRIYRGPEHVTCNLRAAAKAGNAAQRRRQPRRAQTRRW